MLNTCQCRIYSAHVNSAPCFAVPCLIVRRRRAYIPICRSCLYDGDKVVADLESGHYKPVVWHGEHRTLCYIVDIRTDDTVCTVSFPQLNGEGN